MLRTESIRRLKKVLECACTDFCALNDFASLIAEQLPAHKLAEDDLAQIVAFCALDVQNNPGNYDVIHPILVEFVQSDGDICALSANLPEVLHQSNDEDIIDFADTYEEVSQKFFGKP